MAPWCSVCWQKPAVKEASIFLSTRMTSYYVIVYTYMDTSLRFPACGECGARVAFNNFFNKNGIAGVIAGVVALGIGLWCVWMGLEDAIRGHYAALLDMPVTGLPFILFAIPAIWMYFRSRRKVRSYLAALGYR